MEEADDARPPTFDRFSLRVVSGVRCRQPEVLLAQGQQEEDPAILALRHVALQLRVPAYALLLPLVGGRARVRKVFPADGEYLLTARQWDHVLATLLSKHVCSRSPL